MKDREKFFNQVLTEIDGIKLTRGEFYAMSNDKKKELLFNISSMQLEDICGRGYWGPAIRDQSDDIEEKTLVHELNLLRPFGYATRDESWGELEKIFNIVFRNYIDMRRFIELKGLWEEYDDFEPDEL